MLASTGLTALALSLSTASSGPIINFGEHTRYGTGTLPSLVEGAVESNDLVTIYDETRGIVPLTEPLNLDTLVFNGLASLDDGHLASLPTGTRVVSLLLHFDPEGQPSSPADMSAWFIPYGPVGLIYSDALLDASDSILGRSGTLYPSGVAGRGLEADSVQITEYVLPSGRRGSTTTVNWSESGSGIDSMRVVIAIDLPEPGTALLVLGGVMIGLRRRPLGSET